MITVMAYFLSSVCPDFLYNLGKNAYLSWAFTHLLNGNYGALHYCEGYAMFLKFLSFLGKLLINRSHYSKNYRRLYTEEYTGTLF